MSDTGFIYGSSVTSDSSGTDAWTNTNNLFADDIEYASIKLRDGDVSHILTLSGFTLTSLPNDCTIRGIEVGIEADGSSSSGTSETILNVKIKNVGSGKNSTSLGASDPLLAEVLGSQTDVWGLTGSNLTGSGLKSSFELKLRASNPIPGASGQTDYNLNYVRVKIYYELYGNVHVCWF